MSSMARFVLFLLPFFMTGQCFGLGGDFSLTAHDGSRYALQDSRGKVVVLSFGYTYCPDVCPTALATIAGALGQLGDDAETVDALFISLDPDRDTPEKLAEYTRFFHPNLRGLTGTAEDEEDDPRDEPEQRVALLQAATADELEDDQDEEHGGDRGGDRDPHRRHRCTPSEGTAYRRPIATNNASVTLIA